MVVLFTPIITSHQLPAILYPYCNEMTTDENNVGQKKILFKKRRTKLLEIIEQLLFNEFKFRSWYRSLFLNKFHVLNFPYIFFLMQFSSFEEFIFGSKFFLFVSFFGSIEDSRRIWRTFFDSRLSTNYQKFSVSWES